MPKETDYWPTKRKTKELNWKTLSNKRSLNFIQKKQPILLSRNKNQLLIWDGLIQEKKDINEEPLILNFDNKDFYFYKKNIKRKNSHKNQFLGRNSWIFYDKLKTNQKEKIINEFEKVTNQEIPYWKSSWLKMKLKQQENRLNELTTMPINQIKKLLKEEEINLLYKIYSSLREQNKAIVSENNDILKNENELKTANDNEETKEILNKLNVLEKKSIICDFKFDSLFNFFNKKIEKFDNLIKNFPEIEPVLYLNSKKKFKKDEVQQKTIVLRGKSKHFFIIWNGTTKKDETNKEEPAVLNFDDQDFYFYSNGIEKKIIKNKNKFWISYEKQLDYKYQDKILKAYEKRINQKNLAQQGILLKLKGDFLKQNIMNFNDEILPKPKDKEWNSKVTDLEKKVFNLKVEVENINAEIKITNQSIDDFNLNPKPKPNTNEYFKLFKSDEEIQYEIKKQLFFEIINNQTKKIEDLKQKLINLKQKNNFRQNITDSIQSTSNNNSTLNLDNLEIVELIDSFETTNQFDNIETNNENNQSIELTNSNEEPLTFDNLEILKLLDSFETNNQLDNIETNNENNQTIELTNSNEEPLTFDDLEILKLLDSFETNNQLDNIETNNENNQTIELTNSLLPSYTSKDFESQYGSYVQTFLQSTENLETELEELTEEKYNILDIENFYELFKLEEFELT